MSDDWLWETNWARKRLCTLFCISEIIAIKGCAESDKVQPAKISASGSSEH